MQMEVENKAEIEILMSDKTDFRKTLIIDK